MEIGILRSSFKEYGSRRLLEEASKVGKGVKLDPRHLCLILGNKLDGHSIYEKDLARFDVVIPRFRTKYFDFGLLATQHLENMRIPVLNSAVSIKTCKNKYLTSLTLQKKRIPQPLSAVALGTNDIMRVIKHLPKPLVFKTIQGSEGFGISKINNDGDAKDWAQTFAGFHAPIYIQEFIDHGGEDYRILIVGDKIAAAIKRISKNKNWKTNISQGNVAVPFKPSNELKELAFKCTDAVKTDICGVDIAVDQEKGPMVIELNQFAGFKGTEKATKKNIAREIIRLAVKKARQ
ncbi:RimK family alpha-L-glutamate ligase [Candidatus Woesearchaeota archaeon]|nr:RimK family alpha-L-glutamate ligase [Candidatus Woesearchaeota archaeon]